ncbi:nicotinate-nucleotide--dimethylbenzimidazole phosphoribosyltransferase [Ferroplasma sp.]|uniref:nicotinate-nucleotide--dimethylbenzimidazole phosphoribosyltransferase n=1 Tax=Ferroplasma sp. TaxID=2591003 RepID=UPI00307E511C
MEIVEGNSIYNNISDKNDILYILLAGTTEVSTIPGISDAGASPELTKLTPVLDSEIIYAGKCISYNVVPMTENGIPTPSIITRGSNQLSGIDILIVDSGMVQDPKIPFIKTGLGSAGNGSEKRALLHYWNAMEYGKYLGNLLDGKYKYICISESVPGGTTTAYTVLLSEGINEMTSSSMKDSPDGIKKAYAEKALSRKINFRDDNDNIAEFGDYMMAIALGISSAVKKSTIFYAGGTQMATVFYLDQKINNKDNRYVFTTGYIMKDKEMLMKKLVGSKLIYANMNFSGMDGLKYYDQGYVKEGTGFGAAFGISYLLGNDPEKIYESIKNTYKLFLK